MLTLLSLDRAALSVAATVVFRGFRRWAYRNQVGRAARSQVGMRVDCVQAMDACVEESRKLDMKDGWIYGQGIGPPFPFLCPIL